MASFHLNNFRNYKSKSKISDEIWLTNEGLPTGEGLFQLYIWFCKERGFIVDKVIEDLNVLGGVIRKEKEEEFRKEREWRETMAKKK